MMRALDIIAKKRDGLSLLKEEIEFFVQGYTRGDIPDYQAAAWLMAIYLKGMSKEETIHLTQAIANSGTILDLTGIVPLAVDKHSTGGVGDKTTLVVAPLVSAAGVPVSKVSGRGLGFTGGTLDKLESFQGFTAALDIPRFLDNLSRHGIVVAGQTEALAPADGKLYALRDAIGAVGSLPLIASSIMSKKIAAGAKGIVLDVKVGSGAFMKDDRIAMKLALIMVDIGVGLGRRVSAVLSDMNQPLGYAVGNALEVKEAIQTLQGQGPPDFTELCFVVASQMLILAGKHADDKSARQALAELLPSGKGLAKFKELVEAQGGDSSPVDRPELLPQAPLRESLPAPRSGYISALHAMEIGTAAMLLGAGRAKKGDPIDHAVGVLLHKKIGQRVKKGEPLLTIHARTEKSLEEAKERLLKACTIAQKPVQPPPLIHRLLPWRG